MTPDRVLALEARGISYAYVRGRPVLRDVTLEASEGEIVAVLGTSGSGKSTLLRICRGLLAPQQGRVLVMGTPVLAGRGALDPRIAYIPQQLGLVRSLSVLENVLIGSLARRQVLASLVTLATRGAPERAHALLERLGIGAKAPEKAYALSGGERQRVAIARALMQEPRVLLADEFISQLDPHTTDEIMRIVRGIADEGVAVVMTTHEHRLVREHADRALVLREGETIVDIRPRTAEAADITSALRR